MISKEVTVLNLLGLHARPAARIVKVAAQSKARFWIVKEEERINGKSIMGVMMLAAAKGCKVTLEAEGEGAEELVETVADLFANKFYEE
ncbi:MAG: HPr family phosphocarrier protein [Candidatus Zixiibacteriota bacterium]|nr:MAG: HPr family phosphocarrier protein [candidate division Zixibacteria bacterium]